MEKILSREPGLMNVMLPAAAVLLVALAMVVIAYGMDTVAPGVHDTFHDFRHVMGMPCH